MLFKEKSYPFTRESLNYLLLSRGKRILYKINQAIDKIDLQDPRQQRVFNTVVICMAIILYASPVCAAVAGANPFDSIGFKFLNYARSAGYWICLIKAVMVIIKAAMEEDIFSCWKKVIGYLIAFASLYFLPQMFNAVKF